MLAQLALAAASITLVKGQVTATFPNGATNPAQPSLGAYNQNSNSRLVTLNSVDDFCLWGPQVPGPDSLIGNTEPTVVAWCTKPRNNARLIPDGTIQAAHFVRTATYVQIQGFLDGTKLNIPYGDDGGELDPHGAEGTGNPVGGNVTSNVSGRDVFYEEWMSFMSYNQFCLRICTSQTSSVSAALQCEHELDVMGCQFVMPGDYTNNTFTSCEGQVAAAPGLYPQADGSTSTFRQRFTYTANGQPVTIGNLVTPSGPAFIPSTSNCQTVSTIANGVAIAGVQTGVPASSRSVASSTGAASSRITAASSSGAAASSRATSGTGALASSASRTGSQIAASATSALPASGASRSIVGLGANAYAMVGLVGAMVVGGAAVML